MPAVMKRIVIVLLAAASLMLPFSCNPSSSDDPVEDIVLQDPITKDHAVVTTFNTPLVLSVGRVHSIEMTEAARYIMAYEPLVKSKSTGGEDKVAVGSYVFKDGEYILSPLGITIKIVNGKVFIDGEEVDATVITVSTSGNRDRSNAARNWKINSIRIKVGGNGVNISKSYSGFDLPAIARDIKSKGVNISESDIQNLNGYVVKEIIMTGSNTFVISFTGADPFVGTWTLSGNTFTYTLSETDNPILTGGSASGSLEITGTNSAVLSVKASIVTDGTTYTAEFVMEITAVNQ